MKNYKYFVFTITIIICLNLSLLSISQTAPPPPESGQQPPPESGQQPPADNPEQQPPTQPVYEPASGSGQQLNWEKVMAEEMILSNRRVVLRPEFKPRFALSISANQGVIPERFVGVPTIKVLIRFEVMYKNNLTLFFHGGVAQAFGFYDKDVILNQYFSEHDPVNDFYNEVKDTTRVEKVGGSIGFGGGFGGRIRLEEEIKGLFLGMGIDAFYRKVYGHQGLGFVAREGTPSDRGPKAAIFRNAVKVAPYFEGGYTLGLGPVLLEFSGQLGLNMIFGDGRFIDLGERGEVEYLAKYQDLDFSTAPTIYETRFALEALFQLAMTVGFRW